MSTAFGSLTKPPPDLPPIPDTPSLRTSNDMTWMMGYWTAALNGKSPPCAADGLLRSTDKRFGTPVTW
ncbi:hypothetical protein E4U45_007503 [Claviceps purpurea]|nr:hypothetical protein E4U45_007503 [Claviceps purpurea]